MPKHQQFKQGGISSMRQNMWQIAIVSVLALGLVLTPAVATPPVKAAPAKAAANSSTTSEVVTALHEANTLLDTAIHDYDGHRAKAVGEVHHAIHELSSHHHKSTNGATTPAAKVAAKEAKPANGAATTTPGENQAQSDKQLKQALEILSGLSGSLPKNHAKASGHVQTAIEELNVALKIK